jgi:hypothetical protein
VGQRLRGFAQAHVVGQDSAQTVQAQVLQPGQSFHLVGAQLHLQAGGRGHCLRRAHGFQTFGQAGQAQVAFKLPGVVRPIAVGLQQAGSQGIKSARFPGVQAQKALIL